MKRKLLSLVLTLAMLASLLTPAFAAQGASFTDTDGHWAQTSVDRWAGAGVMNGTGSGFQPDKTMTRAEFAQMLVNLLGYTEKAQNTFKDVPNDAWFADAVLKLAAAGVMQGDGVNANPNAEISRAEMAVLLCRALNIQPKAASGLSFADAASVPSWAEDAMAALAERGMISGVGGNQVAPTLSVTRASVAKLLDNLVGVYANEPGQVISGEVKGLVIVVADGVTLKDAAVAENLVVAPKAGGAAVTVTGKSTVGDVYVAADGAKLTVDKDAAAGDILVDAAKAAVTVDGKADAVMTTESASAASLSVGGTVSSVSLAGADSELKVSGTVKSVDISATASGADVNVAKGGSIDTVKTSADDVKIAGEGTVKTVEVTAGSGVAVDTKGTEVKVSENAETVLVNGKEVKPGETANVPSGGGGGGGGSNPGPSVTTYNVTFDANGGTFAHPTDPADPGVYVINDTVKVEKAPEQPTRSGYTFKGWYTAAEGGTAITFPYTPGADVIIHAQWDKVEPSIYTIRFDAAPGIFKDRGESDSNNVYAFRTDSPYAAPSETPVYGGHEFQGWYTDKACTMPAVYPDADHLTNATYYAKWADVYEKFRLDVSSKYTEEGTNKTTTISGVAYSDYTAMYTMPIGAIVSASNVTVDMTMKNVGSLGVTDPRHYNITINTGIEHADVTLADGTADSKLNSFYNFGGTTIKATIDGKEVTYTLSAADKSDGSNIVINAAPNSYDAAQAAWMALTSHMTAGTGENNSKIVIAKGATLQIGNQLLKFEDNYSEATLVLDNFTSANAGNLITQIKAAVQLVAVTEDKKIGNNEIAIFLPANTALHVGSSYVTLDDAATIKIALPANADISGLLPALRQAANSGNGLYSLVALAVDALDELVGGISNGIVNVDITFAS